MNALYERMLSAYDQSTDTGRRNAIYEVSQRLVLAGLSNGGFFDKAAFYGGTCLRIFHGLDRFSEDMDFTLLKEDRSFNFEQYFQPIIDQFAVVGRNVEIKKKDKKSFGKVESAFLKDNTDVYDISFQTERSVKVKIEVDIVPPMKFSTEQKLLLQPMSFMTRCVALPFIGGRTAHERLRHCPSERRSENGLDYRTPPREFRRGIHLDLPCHKNAVGAIPECGFHLSDAPESECATADTRSIRRETCRTWGICFSSSRWNTCRSSI